MPKEASGKSGPQETTAKSPSPNLGLVWSQPGLHTTAEWPGKEEPRRRSGKCSSLRSNQGAIQAVHPKAVKQSHLEEGLGGLDVESGRQGGHEAATQGHKPTESGRPPTAPHLLMARAPRPRPSQGKGMERLRPGTWVPPWPLRATDWPGLAPEEGEFRGWALGRGRPRRAQSGQGLG